MCILQLLNKFSGALSSQHFSRFVYPLMTVLIFAVRQITPCNLLDILRARETEQYKMTEKWKAQWGKTEKNRRAPDTGSTVILKSRTIVNLNSRALFLTLRRTYRRRHGENASASAPKSSTSARRTADANCKLNSVYRPKRTILCVILQHYSRYPTSSYFASVWFIFRSLRLMN